jgi:hypothetical protein
MDPDWHSSHSCALNIFLTALCPWRDDIDLLQLDAFSAQTILITLAISRFFFEHAHFAAYKNMNSTRRVACTRSARQCLFCLHNVAKFKRVPGHCTNWTAIYVLYPSLAKNQVQKKDILVWHIVIFFLIFNHWEGKARASGRHSLAGLTYQALIHRTTEEHIRAKLFALHADSTFVYNYNSGNFVRP